MSPKCIRMFGRYLCKVISHFLRSASRSIRTQGLHARCCSWMKNRSGSTVRRCPNQTLQRTRILLCDYFFWHGFVSVSPVAELVSLADFAFSYGSSLRRFIFRLPLGSSARRCSRHAPKGCGLVGEG